MNWLCLSFDQLTTDQLYDALKLRVDVFVVEQNCPYAEIDNKDRAPGSYHLLGYQEGQLVAYARLLQAGTTYSTVSFGRVATHHSVRSDGVGKKLMASILDYCQELWPNQSITIGAQEHLQGFYGHFGLQTISDVYLEDDIPHVDMKLSK